jgi:UDP-glucuronate 4-epimerase
MRLAGEGREIVLPGSGRRDWIYSRDVAAALLHLLDSGRSDPAVVNVAPGEEWTIAEWCGALAARQPRLRWRLAAAGEAANVDFWSTRDRARLSDRRLVEAYGFRPRFGLVAALDDLLDWHSRQ